MLRSWRHASPAALAAIFSWTIFGECSAEQNDASRSDLPIPTPSVNRKLEDMEGAGNNDNRYGYDLSQYSIRYGRCQNVKTFDDEIAENEESDTVFAMKHFVVFRLCPSDSCDTCSSDYGEYVLPVEDYLAATTEQQRQVFENLCEQCEEACQNGGGQCDSECEQCGTYENLENYGYVDASDYVQCQQVDVANDDDGDDDGDGMELYIGPRCSANGKRIYIGLFYDEECGVPYEPPDGQTVGDIIGAKLWYHTLKSAYSSDSGDCMSCAEDAEDENENDNKDVDNVNEMCEEVYSASAKCESIHGIQGGFIQINREEQDYENQVENEFMVCTFIESLVLDSYTEMGEINIYEKQDVVIRETTPLQKGMLTLLSLTAFSLASYAVWLSREIDIDFPEFDLQCMGGTIA